jgi:polyvinyl alcohol dehydrogenase (cytochrome)
MKLPSSSRAFATLILLVAGVSLSVSPQKEVVAPVKPETGTGRCRSNASILGTKSGAAGWNGWGVDPSNSRFQPVAQAGLTESDVPRLRLKWAFGFEGANMAFSQPAIAEGRLFVGSESGSVFALDPSSGCMVWNFQAQSSVRTGFVIGPGAIKHPQNASVYFGDQHGAVYALDSVTGQLLWKAQADPHPAAMITGTPQLWQGRLYVPVASYEENFAPDTHYQCCTFRGSVVAYDAQTGKSEWQTYIIAEVPHKTSVSKAGTQLWGPSGAGVWSAPTLNTRTHILYVSTGNNYSDPVTTSSDAVLALNMDTGKILWTQQATPNDAYNSSCALFMDATQSNCPPENGSDYDFGASPILVTVSHSRSILIAAQKSGVVYGLDPTRGGKVIWQKRVGKGGPLGGIEWGAAVDRRNVYLALSDCDWKTFDRAKNGQKESVVDIDPDKGGGLFALRLTDGHQVWQTPTPAACADREHCGPAQLAAVTTVPGVIFSGSLDGHLRAYSSHTGKILWDFNTIQDYSTVNGVPAHGGSLNGPGAVVVGGMLYVNSGYGRFGEAAGNVFLAFSVRGK